MSPAAPSVTRVRAHGAVSTSYATDNTGVIFYRPWSRNCYYPPHEVHPLLCALAGSPAGKYWTLWTKLKTLTRSVKPSAHRKCEGRRPTELGPHAGRQPL